MSDIGLSHGLNANTNVHNEHVDGAASAASDGALHASEDGATYDGSAGADATYASEHASGSAGAGADASGSASADGVDVDPSVTGLPDVGELPDLPVDTPELPATPDVPDVGELPELPELPVDTGAVDGATGGVGADATLEGWLDAMGELMAQFAASVSAMIGL